MGPRNNFHVRYNILSINMWVKITKKPNSIGRPSWCIAPKHSSNFATGCDVINRWITGIRNKCQALFESCNSPSWFYILVTSRKVSRRASCKALRWDILRFAESASSSIVIHILLPLAKRINHPDPSRQKQTERNDIVRYIR